MLGQENQGKLCQSCIERGFNPPNPASREFNPNEFLCEDCFQSVLANLQSFAPGSLEQSEVKRVIQANAGPILETIYNLLGTPNELRFDTVDTTCRQYDKIFNFHAPAVVNYGTIEELADEIEQRAMALFHIKYSMEPLEMKINQLKSKAREEKKLKGVTDSVEKYSTKKGSSKVKATQEEKMAKTLGMPVEKYREMVKKAREAEFNSLVGNCVKCGQAEHKGPCNDKEISIPRSTTSDTQHEIHNDKGKSNSFKEIIPGSKEAKKVETNSTIKRRF